MKHPDLFGGETEVVTNVPKRGWLEIKKDRGYKDAVDKNVSCKTCEHCVYKEFSKRYYKCKLMSLEASATSDVRLKCVCDQWEKRK